MSKGFDEYYQKGKELGIEYIRCRPPVIDEIPETNNLVVTYIDEKDQKVTREYDMLVLSVGMDPPEKVKEISEKFGIEGFPTIVLTARSQLSASAPKPSS